MKLSKLTKRHLIRIVFLVPFILCLVTSIGIKSFLDNQAYKRPEATEYNLMNIVNYRLSTLYMPEDLEGRKRILLSTTENLDNLKGIGASLYYRDGDEYNQLTELFADPENNEEDLIVPENYFQPDKLAFSREGYIVGEYGIPVRVHGFMTEIKVYWATYGNYVLVWIVRPDMINSYFVDYDTMFGLIVIVFLINCIASFIALIAYYCLENRVRHFITRRKID